MEKRLQGYKKLFLHDAGQLYAVQNDDGQGYTSTGALGLTDTVLKAHLEGHKTIAVRLSQVTTSLTKAGCVDIDGTKDELGENYELAVRIRDTAAEEELKGYIEFSGNKGFHIWFFSKQPIPSDTMYLAIVSVCLKAGYPPKEIYPLLGEVEVDGKGSGGQPVKLPGGIHKKTGRLCGFLADEVEWDEEGYPVVPEDQGAIIDEIEQNSPQDLYRLALEMQPSEDSEPETDTAHEVDFSLLAPGEHPHCIAYLLEKGVPSDLEYNKANMILANYTVDSSLSDEQGTEIARIVAGKTSPDHPTSKKTVREKVSNFTGVLRSVRRNDSKYHWGCGFVRASKELVADDGCLGRGCPFWPWSGTKDAGWVPSRLDFVAEEEFFSFLFHNPEKAAELLDTTIPVSGFQWREE
ncbi:MAG TPA: hypothetical protein PK411_12295 [Mesotoga infera]|nr:hypothetical protein [Mesotoga infera]